MKKLVRTTITIPEPLYKQAKMIASFCGESFSAYVTEALNQKLKGEQKIKKKKIKTTQDVVGVFSLAIKKVYKKRSDLYDKYIQRKMGL